ncbi:unnamed protein product [Spirodela intermedia]|uniref:RNA helicase n=1 Tax=Spirodela intermedia TaxID=51605 RepID=A0A7I8J5H4_SPIIN|nr:unnamed protein product [Spirodela intermedia]CAA6665351.1 unnamed protein product [Spirodela intermedia]
MEEQIPLNLTHTLLCCKLCSSLGDDTNMILLPGTKKKKRKVVSKEGSVRPKPDISKSEDRKLKQLQEKKKRMALESESIKLLKKHEICDNAYALLYSSGTIGQVESRKKRCLRAANFSKAGLKVSEDLKSSKNACKPVTDCESEYSMEHFPKQKFLEKSSADIRLQQKESTHVLDNDGNMTCKSFQDRRSPILPPTPEVDNNDTGTVDTQRNGPILPSCNRRPKFADSQCLEKVGSDVNHVKTVVHPDLSFNKTVEAPSVVHVLRSSSIEEERRGLPIVMMEQEIMEAINGNSIVIICGETGCGKTTQVPQFLYESGYGSRGSSNRKGKIGITLPRRVAVLATAKRVSHELNLPLGKDVGYQVRHEKKIGENCSIKFMTDGILLLACHLLETRDVATKQESDLLLRQYSIIILDEAHERSLNTDILIGMLSRVVWLRQKLFMEQQEKMHKGLETSSENVTTQLKLVLMSATLRVEDFISDGRLFHDPPVVLEVPTRQFPVTIHFSKKGDYGDYIRLASKKVMQIHRTLPVGGILVFVTGKSEAEYLCQKLRKESQGLHKTSNTDIRRIMEGITDGFRIGGNSHDLMLDEFISQNEEDDDYSCSSESDEEEVIEESNSESAAKSRDMYSGLYVLPLYAMLPADEQLRVFKDAPEGQRLVVVATNVAETSLTIPGIKYVVDTGREKVKNYNYRNGMAAYEVKWISKASAAQRAGRAGRTGPGHCYRLYSSAIFSNVFADFSSPEITKVPVAGVVLLMKSMGINKVANFPFPTPPLPTALSEADRCLKALEALDSEGCLTHVGRAMSRYPMSPRHSRMLLSFVRIMRLQQGYSRANLVFGYAIAAAAALSFHNPFIIPSEGNNNEDTIELDRDRERDGKKQRLGKPEAAGKQNHARFRNHNSDALSVSYLLQLHDIAGTKVKKVEFCRKNMLHFKTMDEMSKLRKQLLELIFHLGGSDEEFSWCYGSAEDVESAWYAPGNQPLLMKEEELVGQAICAGWADMVAKRIHAYPKSSDKDYKVRAARYQSCALGETVFLHPGSSVSHTPPEFLVYTELLCTKRPYLHGVTAVKPEWLVKYASALCNFSAPLLEPRPCYDSLKDQVLCWVSPIFGPHLWQLPLHGIPAENEMVRISIFACALLEGGVLPCLRSIQRYLVASPTIILRPESMEDEAGNVIIDRRAILCEVWRKNPQLLRSEIHCWFKEEFQHLFDELWGKMHEEAQLEGEQLFMAKGKKKHKGKRKLSKNKINCSI